MPDAVQSAALWQRLMEMGAVACGLGSRDVLRLEAGLLLHGSDMDAAVNPLEAGLDRFVHMDKESIYSAAVAKQLGGRHKAKASGHQHGWQGSAQAWVPNPQGWGLQLAR